MNALTDDDKQRINQAVQQAESHTSAEIVPVVAASSGRYDRAEDIAGLWLALIALSVVWALFPMPAIEPGNWSAWSPVWQLIALLAAVVCGFILGAAITTKISSLRRLFTPAIQMQEEVNRRAREVFFDQRVHHTQAASGVLLYVSMFEHIAVVLADDSVLQRLGQESINELCRSFTRRLRTQDLTTAFCETIHAVGEQLAPSIPKTEGDTNELPDALIVID
jgi:putative membrane protein